MKIYEKPMALIERIEVEDVITASIGLEGTSDSAKAFNGNSQNDVIVFEW